MKSIFTIFTFCFVILTLGQETPESDGYYHTRIKIAGIENNGDAKNITDRMREITGVILIKFNDETDTFTFRTKAYAEPGKLENALIESGFSVIE